MNNGIFLLATIVLIAGCTAPPGGNNTQQNCKEVTETFQEQGFINTFPNYTVVSDSFTSGNLAYYGGYYFEGDVRVMNKDNLPYWFEVDYTFQGTKTDIQKQRYHISQGGDHLFTFIYRNAAAGEQVTGSYQVLPDPIAVPGLVNKTRTVTKCE